MNNTDLDTLRHSAAHVLATATLRLFPDAKIGVGPVTEDGFYYDFEFGKPIAWDDVKRIEQEMNIIIQEDLPFRQFFAPKEQSFNILLSRGQIYKAELLREIDDSEMSFFKTGEEFVDLCRGPHLESTRDVGAVKLTSLSTTYWKGDKTRPEMQRIEGTAFPTIEELQKFLLNQNEMENRDFRILAKELKLQIPSGRDVIYTPNGSVAMEIIMDKVIDVLPKSYQLIVAPPSTEPQSLLQNIDELYSMKNRSYKELPFGLYIQDRIPLIPTLNFLDRELTAGTVIVTKSYFEPLALGGEVRQLSQMINALAQSLQLDFNCKLVTPDLNSEHTHTISNLLLREGISQVQVVDPESSGIKVIFMAEDELRREWELVVAEYQVSEQTYISRAGEINSVHTFTYKFIIDMFLAYFIEDNNGALPMWLAPVQCLVIPITENQISYAEKILEHIENIGYRSKLDTRNETMQSRIRDAEILKIPAILIIGEKEAQNNAVSLRLKDKREIGMISLDLLAGNLQQL